jgi:hypothetical protein
VGRQTVEVAPQLGGVWIGLRSTGTPIATNADTARAWASTSATGARATTGTFAKNRALAAAAFDRPAGSYDGHVNVVDREAPIAAAPGSNSKPRPALPNHLM